MTSNIIRDGWILEGRELAAMRNREYHYNAWSDTILDTYMQPFWRYTVSFIPSYVAPSTLSACGLLCNIMATCITIYFAPTLTEPLPSAVSVMNAVSIFLYQTFDGMDGKQCARVQDSEIEEYTDHGVDSVSVVLNAVLLGAALQLGASPVLLGVNFFLVLSAFFAAHWAGHRTRTLVFGRIDVTEAQWSMIAIHLATAWGGFEFWDYPICVNPLLTSRQAVCWMSSSALLFASASNMALAIGIGQTPLETHGIPIPRANFSPGPLISYVAVMSGFLLCVKSGLLSLLPITTMLIVGLTMGKAAMELILQKLSMKDELSLDISILCPLGLCAMQQWTSHAETLRGGSWALLAGLLLDVVVFHARALSDLKKARALEVFRVKGNAEGPPAKPKGFYVAGGNLAETQKAWREFVSDKDRFQLNYPDSCHDFPPCEKNAEQPLL